jgi:hypothetical protein
MSGGRVAWRMGWVVEKMRVDEMRVDEMCVDEMHGG